MATQQGTDTTSSPRSAGIEAMGIIAATKLQPPRPRIALVPRDALVALLAGGAHTKLTLLSAPAGSGKTTLLTQWHHAAFESRPFAWLSLDASDNDPARFWTCVIEALGTVVPDAGSAAAGALPFSGASLEDAVVPLLINELVGWEQPAVLVLDDLHEVTEPKVHASLSYLLDHMPGTLHLAVATREDPDLPLHRLRARDQSVELRAGHLRFSDAEAALFLNEGLGLELGEQDVARIQERTDGWAAGLQLAGLSFRGQTGGPWVLDAVSAGDREIGEYLIGEVLEGVPPDLREFMLQTSICERMSGSLCDAITGMGGSAARLRELERRNLFTLAVDAEREWYRYHPLFAEALRRELRDREREQVAALHVRASAWCSREGAIPEAIAHAIAAGDAPGAVELVASNWTLYFNRGWLDTVAGWLRALPEAAVRGDSRLWLAHAWTALDVGALAEVEAWLESPSDGDETRQAWADILRALHRFKGGDVGRALADARRVHPEAGTAPGFLRTVAALGCAVPAFWLGDSDDARVAFDEGRRLADADENLLAEQYALGYLALEAVERGALDEAAGLVGAVDALVAREPPIAEHFTALVVRLARGHLAARDRALDTAEAQMRRAVELARRGAGAPEVAGALLAHAAVLTQLGDHARAAGVRSEAGALLARCPDPGRLAAQLAQAESGTARPRRPASRRDELSDGEHRVLRLLPTELSLREIGGELFISLNTVKTHTRNIYAKLDSGNRAKAVARARELGLL